jgi:hypothetical protein
VKPRKRFVQNAAANGSTSTWWLRPHCQRHNRVPLDTAMHGLLHVKAVQLHDVPERTRGDCPI